MRDSIPGAALYEWWFGDRAWLASKEMLGSTDVRAKLREVEGMYVGDMFLIFLFYSCLESVMLFVFSVVCILDLNDIHVDRYEDSHCAIFEYIKSSE